MPTNLPPEARAKWIKVMEARTPEERLRALEEFLSVVPKHKGTENLVHWVRRRIAQLRREIEAKKLKERAVKARGGASPYIEKEGDAQVVVIGPPLSGKSSLLKCLTNARVEPDDLPYTDSEPIPGMFIEDNVYFQLIKVPSLNLDDVESSLNVLAASMIRNADGVILVLDASQDPLWQFNRIREVLKEHGVYIVKPRGYVTIEKRPMGGIQVSGRLVGATTDDVRKLLMSYGINNAIVKIEGEATLDDIEEAILKDFVYKPTVVLLNKADLVGGDVAYYVKTISVELPVLPCSLIECKIDRKSLCEALLKAMDLIRVYTKEPESPTYSPKPFVLKKGSTVGDLARMIHSRLYETFKYARIWKIDRFPNNPKRVGLNYELNDGDVVEIHSTL